MTPDEIARRDHAIIQHQNAMRKLDGDIDKTHHMFLALQAARWLIVHLRDDERVYVLPADWHIGECDNRYTRLFYQTEHMDMAHCEIRVTILHNIGVDGAPHFAVQLRGPKSIAWTSWRRDSDYGDWYSNDCTTFCEAYLCIYEHMQGKDSNS